MYYFERFKKKIINDLYDHPVKKNIIELTYVTIVTLLSSFLFSLGFNAFTNPNFTAIAAGGVDLSGVTIYQLASCGASGLSQSILIILKCFGLTWLANETNANIMYWIFSFAVNVPLLLLAWFGIGKRFAIFTALNVAFASVFGILLKSNDPNFFINQISRLFIEQPLGRVVFAGLFTGVSSGLAYVIETSAGGADIASYYISEKKGILVGKYSLIINIFIIALFGILSMIQQPAVFNTAAVPFGTALTIFLYTLVYMVVATTTVDKINTQNMKVQVQIITSQKNLSNSIIAALPHSCTILNGYGGYSLEGKYILLMTIRKKEVTKLIQICKKEDPKAFVDVIPLDNVYGKFYRKKIK